MPSGAFNDNDKSEGKKYKSRKGNRKNASKSVSKTIGTRIAEAYHILATTSVRKVECIVVREETKYTHNSPAITKDGLSE